MARDTREQLTKWLNDAYGMEKSMIQTLERHAKDAEGNPELKSRIERHIEETKGQCDIVQQCIEQLGGSVSGFKGVAANFMGALQGMTTGLAPDELVKNGIMDYAAEHFEIASYKAIQHLATKIGETEVADKVGRIIAEEEAMATFLDQHLAGTVDLFASEELEQSTGTQPGRAEPAFGESIDQDRDEL